MQLHPLFQMGTRTLKTTRQRHVLDWATRYDDRPGTLRHLPPSRIHIATEGGNFNTTAMKNGLIAVVSQQSASVPSISLRKCRQSI